MALTDISGKLDYENTTKFTMRKCSRIQKKKRISLSCVFDNFTTNFWFYQTVAVVFLLSRIC